MYKFYTRFKYDASIYVFEFKPSDNLVPLICISETNKQHTLNNIRDEEMEKEGYHKLAGINLSRSLSTGFGLAYNDGELIIGDIDNIYHNGSLEIKLSYSLVLNGEINIQGEEGIDNFNYKYPRTLIGKKEDGTIVLCSVDGRSKKSRGITAQESAQIMLNLGCTTAINANGNGYSQMYYKGRIINDYPTPYTRSISNALLVYSKDKITTELIKDYPSLRAWSKGDYVSILQRLLKSKGYIVNVNGVYDPLTYSSVKSFQKNNALTENGMVDETVWAKLFL